MDLLGIERLEEFKRGHPDAEAPLNAWRDEVEEASWDTPHDLKGRYPKASLLGDQQVIFDILGNRYRLWVKILYKLKAVLVLAVGTHKEYDKWKTK